MPLRPLASPPKKLPIDLAQIESAKGSWLVAVETVAETIADRNLLLTLILEQRIDDEHFRMRELSSKVRASDARDPGRSAYLLDRIRDWIESTDGDGFVDMVE
jgi:hypothetical protein